MKEIAVEETTVANTRRLDSCDSVPARAPLVLVYYSGMVDFIRGSTVGMGMDGLV